jgi:hypothetical protein
MHWSKAPCRNKSLARASRRANAAINIFKTRASPLDRANVNVYNIYIEAARPPRGSLIPPNKDDQVKAAVKQETVMSAYSGSYQPSYEQEPHRQYRHGCGSFHWRPIEILAMVLGFALFWPIGLAIVFWKVWQRKHDYQGDLATFIQEKWQAKRERYMAPKADWARGASRFSGWGHHSSGNSAFDEWRSAELARLEEERQKLVAAEREFGDFMDNLRRAKDREEFDRFMSARRNWQQQPPSDTPPAA